MIDRAPALSLPLSNDASLELPPRERWLALYFYPKSNTPGCTTEGHDFDALLARFNALGCDVVGVSRDSLRVQQGFCNRQGYGFPVASDADGRACEAFDVIREKTMYGRKVVGIERSTFLIAPGGDIVESWRKVRVPGHAAAVLDALRRHVAGDAS
ncbi:peroxiredoxin [Lysobacter humi (ex Lee et al. 2017)]